jgi:hypothetical protein
VRDIDTLTFHVNANLIAISLTKLQAIHASDQLSTAFSMSDVVHLTLNAYCLQ